MTINQTIIQVDAFTDTPFKGNPAGVMLVDDQFSAQRMQNIAMEMNLSETAFVISTGDSFRIRYFTPTTEVPLCGHATLSAAHVIFELGIKKEGETINFHTKNDQLSVTKSSGWITMDFPKYTLTPVNVPANFEELVGFVPTEVYSSDDDWIIAIASDLDHIKNARPRFESLEKYGLGHLMITAECNIQEADFVVRCFAPKSGINEDPVTGSAHCALTPLWANKLGKMEMTSMQLSDRTGKLIVNLTEDRVQIKGQAVTVIKGELQI